MDAIQAATGFEMDSCLALPDDELDGYEARAADPHVEAEYTHTDAGSVANDVELVSCTCSCTGRIFVFLLIVPDALITGSPPYVSREGHWRSVTCVLNRIRVSIHS
jgi:hypothetical protein